MRLKTPALVAEAISVLQDVADGDIEACGKLQPRLYDVLPVLLQREENRPELAVIVKDPSERLDLLRAAAKAAGRGLALVAHGGSSSGSSTSSSSSHSSGSSLSANRQGLMCVARCCMAVVSAADSHIIRTRPFFDSRTQAEAAAAVGATGAHGSTLAAWIWMTAAAAAAAD